MTSSKLKIIACITMLIDHTGATLFPQYIIFRMIGRLAFPIFAYLIVEGYLHTKDIGKYLLRLISFALISEVFFDLAFSGVFFDPSHQNIFFTLFLGLLAITIFDKIKDSNMLLAMVGLSAVIIIHLLAFYLRTDYSFVGVFIIFVLYNTKNNKIAQLVSGAIVLIILSYLTSWVQLFSLVSLVLLYLYNGKKGLSLKYFFYIFYPAHLLIIYLIQRI